ncbi:MAG: aspartyl-tRNA(Asn)/glutamyl-tRNA(Gln) amidotransferase subunit [Planctomycetota bacterium]|nr:aspartyl-tRNA(Asn)/glutamyl-tRNA(Gln) amidotransferase subunit [Planctomycetota bacterium]
MKIDKDQVENIAKLSRIRLTELEREMFVHQLNNILFYIEKLNKLDTENVAPMAYTSDVSNVFREDKLKPSIPLQDVLINAPATKSGFFKVPKVIE